MRIKWIRFYIHALSFLVTRASLLQRLFGLHLSPKTQHLGCFRVASRRFIRSSSTITSLIKITLYVTADLCSSLQSTRRVPPQTRLSSPQTAKSDLNSPIASYRPISAGSSNSPGSHSLAQSFRLFPDSCYCSQACKPSSSTTEATACAFSQNAGIQRLKQLHIRTSCRIPESCRDTLSLSQRGGTSEPAVHGILYYPASRYGSAESLQGHLGP